MAKERSAGAVVYRITEDGSLLYLLLQPAEGKPWGFPKGKLDAGESDEVAARREIGEEAGLLDLAFDRGFRHVVHYVYHRGRAMIKKDVVYFLARAHTAHIRISWEHVKFRWSTLEDAMQLLVYESAQETLRLADAYLKRDPGSAGF